MLDIIRLPRGAALAAEHAEGARSFAVGFWFPLGSRHEAAHERGFVHFVEHMAFKGTSRRSAVALSREIDRVGGYINAFTDRDSICLHCLVPAGSWRLALDVLSDMVFSSLFAEEDFAREREVIVSEILSARDDPEECSHEELLARIWPGDPLSRKIAGEPEDIEMATRAALYDFYRSTLVPGALLVTAAGPVQPSQVAEELARILEAPVLGDRPAASSRGASSPRFVAARAYRSAAMEQVNYFEAVQLDPPFTMDDYYSLSALNGALGEAASSRLFQSLREKLGLCYSIYSAFSLDSSECLWMASANVSTKQLPELALRLGRELDEAGSGGLDERECEDSVSRLAGSFEINLDDPDFRMRRMARQIFFAGKALSIEETRACIAAVGADSINAMCSRLLAGRERARFAYGRKSASAAKALGLEELQP